MYSSQVFESAESIGDFRSVNRPRTLQGSFNNMENASLCRAQIYVFNYSYRVCFVIFAT